MVAANWALSSGRQVGGASWSIFNSDSSWHFLSAYYIPDIILSPFVSVDYRIYCWQPLCEWGTVTISLLQMKEQRWTLIQDDKASRTSILPSLTPKPKHQPISLLFWSWWWTVSELGLGWGRRWFTWLYLDSSQAFFFSCTHWQNSLLFSLCLLFWFTLHLLVASGSWECDAEDGVSCRGVGR